MMSEMGKVNLKELEAERNQLRAEVERLENLKYMGVNAEYVETNNQLRADKAYWQDKALGHIACEQHTETHMGEMVECPFCAADRLREEVTSADNCIAELSEALDIDSLGTEIAKLRADLEAHKEALRELLLTALKYKLDEADGVVEDAKILLGEVDHE